MAKHWINLRQEYHGSCHPNLLLSDKNSFYSLIIIYFFPLSTSWIKQTDRLVRPSKRQGEENAKANDDNRMLLRPIDSILRIFVCTILHLLNLYAMKTIVAVSLNLVLVSAFMPRFVEVRRPHMQLEMATAVIFGTSTGSTETVADLIAEGLDGQVEGPFDIEAIDGSIKQLFEKYDSLIVGTPTWNTGADSERSGTGWDEIYYSTMQEMNLQGKKVAVFGLGDQISYAENYADATGELHDVFQELGCKMFGYTSQEGYEHEDSKAIRGDLFCGLLCDAVNQEELSEERVESWLEQLKGEGFFEGGSPVSVDSAPAVIDVEPVEFTQLEEGSKLMDEAIENYATNGFKAHYNPKTKSTMYVSADGKSCYYSLPFFTTTSFSP